MLFKVFVFDLWKFFMISLISEVLDLVARECCCCYYLILLLWLYLHHCCNASGASLFRMLYLRRYTRASFQFWPHLSCSAILCFIEPHPGLLWALPMHNNYLFLRQSYSLCYYGFFRPSVYYYYIIIIIIGCSHRAKH